MYRFLSDFFRTGINQFIYKKSLIQHQTSKHIQCGRRDLNPHVVANLILNKHKYRLSRTIHILPAFFTFVNTFLLFFQLNCYAKLFKYKFNAFKPSIYLFFYALQCYNICGCLYLKRRGR